MIKSPLANKTKISDKGFTIIELMIALSVLSVLLLICTMVLLNLGKTYVKGNNYAAVQNTARNIMNNVTSQLQLGDVSFNALKSGNGGSYCIGATRYSFLIGQQVEPSPSGSDQTPHALWRDTLSSSGACSDLVNEPSGDSHFPDEMTQTSEAPSDNLSVAGSGSELLSQGMRLTAFSISPLTSTAGLYAVKIGVAYGDSDLLCVDGMSLDGGNDCSQSQISSYPNDHISNLKSPSGQVQCISGIGEQFCAVSNLSENVVSRLES